MRLSLLTPAALALALLPLRAAHGAAPPRPEPKPGVPGRDGKMPLTKLAPSKLAPDLCVLKYRVSIPSEKCQAYFDQGLGYYYSYVWIEASRSFETALAHDPDC